LTTRQLNAVCVDAKAQRVTIGEQGREVIAAWFAENPDTQGES
jgi:hypothetical protein